VVDITFPAVFVNYTVLIGAIIFEAWAFKKAYANMSRQIEENEWSGLREAFRKTSDVTVLTALTEDFIAMAGAGIALFGVYLSRVTGDGIYDAVAAAIIGLMLMGFAVALAWENKRLLLGESMPNEDEVELRDIIAGWDGVERIVDFRTVYFGPEEVVVMSDVVFDETLATEAIDDHITAIEAALKESDAGIRKVYIEPEV
jgi:divalent metal cation (Fe/Co/Zn/Cd) transporter